MKKNVILAHCGPWAKNQFQLIAEGLKPGVPVMFAGLSPQCDDFSLNQRLIEAIKADADSNPSVDDSGFREGMLRCRLLRGISSDTAYVYLSAMDRVWDAVLQEASPNIVISEMIDSYIIASLERACTRHGIPFMGLVTSFVDGYFRVTRYGEHTLCRDPDPEEIERVSKMLLDKKYVPGFVTRPKVATLLVLKRCIKNWLRVFYYGPLSILPSNRPDIHIRGNYIVARQQLQLWPRFQLGSPDWLERARQRQLPVIAVPLQLIPEATVDYWTHDVGRICYDEVLVKVLEKYSGQFTFVIKEHPNVLGDRHPKLYRELERRDGVVFAPTWTPSAELLEECEGILVWTGSMGFEAALRGKAVLAMTPAYYMSGHRFMVLGDEDDPLMVKDFVTAVSARAVTEEETRGLVEHLLSGLIPGKIVFQRNFESVKDKYTDSRVIGEQLRMVINSTAEVVA